MFNILFDIENEDDLDEEDSDSDESVCEDSQIYIDENMNVNLNDEAIIKEIKNN